MKKLLCLVVVILLSGCYVDDKTRREKVDRDAMTVCKEGVEYYYSKNQNGRYFITSPVFTSDSRVKTCEE